LSLWRSKLTFQTCRACLSISIRDTHRCIERSTDCDCPICGEYMFSSPKTVIFTRCGHSIHQTCYKRHMESSFKCPICSRSLINMDLSFRNLDRAIEAQPMPPQFLDTRALINCNDCCAKSSVPYHWLGLKCAHCDSYNTARLRILSGSPAVDLAAGPALPNNEEQSTAEPPNVLPSHSLPEIAEDSSRGRTSLLWIDQRLAASTSALEISHPSAELGRRLTRSISNPRYHRLSDSGSSGSGIMTPPTPVRGSEAMSDNDDVDFWGGGVFRLRSGGSGGETRAADGAEPEYDDNSSDEEAMDLEDIDSEDDDDDDVLDIPGHR
jgi:Zinc-ribbon/Ring finger domain